MALEMYIVHNPFYTFIIAETLTFSHRQRGCSNEGKEGEKVKRGWMNVHVHACCNYS